MPACEWCDREFERRAKMGPTPKFCSGKCRAANHRAKSGPYVTQTFDQARALVPDSLGESTYLMLRNAGLLRNDNEVAAFDRWEARRAGS